MATVEEGLQAQIRNIEATYGKTMPDWFALKRRKQFAMVQPRTAGWLDVGIILKDMPADGRLEWATGFNALFTHRVRITAVAEVDAELVGWLNHAYKQAE